MRLTELYQQAVAHRIEHDCSAYPYEDYTRLFNLVKESQPKRILEIGTGIGFTSVVMAIASPDAKIDTIEKDVEHAKLATGFINNNNLSKGISVHNVVAEEFLPTLSTQYDLIFFDGYQIHYEFLPHYERLLTQSGIMIIGNNHLTSKTSDQFFDELNDVTKWQILEKFADTVVVKKVTN